MVFIVFRNYKMRPAKLHEVALSLHLVFATRLNLQYMVIHSIKRGKARGEIELQLPFCAIGDLLSKSTQNYSDNMSALT